MDESTATYKHFNWQLTLYAAIGTLILYLPIAIISYDIGWLFYACVVTPLICIALVALAVKSPGRRRLASLSILVVYGILSWLILSNYLDARSHARWLFHSRKYKTEVLTQPSLRNGELRHTEWDGWGMAGSDTVVYLVYDPNDSLVSPARNHSGRNANGVACDVWQVHRLESHWYSVVFYTNTAWDDC
jgi:hypothetical protein